MATQPRIRVDVLECLADSHHFGPVSIGACFLLAMHYGWHRSLPESDDDLAAVVKLNKRQWLKIKPEIFEIVEKWDNFFEFVGSTGEEWERALAAPRPPMEMWKALRAAIFARDDYTCTYCGDTESPLECDHIEPASRGGKSVPENLTTACAPCNRSKGAKLLGDWRR